MTQRVRYVALMKTFAGLMSALVIALGIAQLPAAAESKPAAATVVTEEVRKELLAARDRAWRSFFDEDPVASIKEILGPEVIAIQESHEKWENRESLIAMAKSMKAQNIRVVRLEFPRTEIQIFGDVAILYYTYVFANGNDTGVGTLAGRGTEVFVRRDGRWIDVGWHLDNGAFTRRNGAWTRVGAPVPDVK
jgi:hypothetical protein